MHRSGWPDPAELRAVAGPVDPRVLDVAAEVIAAIRKAKSEARVSMRTEVARVAVRGPREELESLRAAAADVRAAGRTARIELEPSPDAELVTDIAL